MEIDEEKDLMDLMGRPLKDKGKTVDKSGEKRLARKKRHRDEIPKEEKLRKAIKRPKRDKEKKSGFKMKWLACLVV